MISLGGQSRQRARELTTKLAASPLLPVLGITKIVETVVAGGPIVAWCAYALIVTGIYVFADELRRRAEDLGEVAQDAVKEATDD
jgi:hypothetical protein